MTDDFYDSDIIERGKSPVPVADDEPAPEAPRRGRPKGAKNKPKVYADTQLGEKRIDGRFSEATYRQFRILAINQRTSGQGLLVEALNMLFKHYKLPQIAGEADGGENGSVL